MYPIKTRCGAGHYIGLKKKGLLSLVCISATTMPNGLDAHDASHSSEASTDLRAIFNSTKEYVDTHGIGLPVPVSIWIDGTSEAFSGLGLTNALGSFRPTLFSGLALSARPGGVGAAPCQMSEHQKLGRA
jgi:hypothetical protein